MPVRSSKGNYLLFNYGPSYLKGKYQVKKTLRTDIAKMLQELGINFDDIPNIKVDGGSIPNLDFYLETSKMIIGFESKFTEGISFKYSPPRTINETLTFD